MNEVLNIKVDRMNKLKNEGKIKAFCDLVFGDLFLVKGFRVVQGEKGLFVGMPQEPGKQEGKWFHTFMPTTRELKEYISEVIIQAYQKEE